MTLAYAEFDYRFENLTNSDFNSELNSERLRCLLQMSRRLHSHSKTLGMLKSSLNLRG